MTTTEELVDKLTVDQLVADDRFVALCNTWQEERHCPLVMPDYLRGLDCWRAAEVATWAVNHTSRIGGRLYPRFSGIHEVYFFVRRKEELFHSEHYLPYHDRVDGGCYGDSGGSFEQSIADFLLNADPVALFTLAPPKAEYSVIDNGGMLVAVN